jgi:putative ABC transport system substrate-binding protein
MIRDRPDALFLVADGLTLLNRKRIIDFAADHNIPAMYEISIYVQDGGLMSYGPNMDDIYRQAATYVDRIFKGAKPNTLPVELPNKFELVIDLKTAKALGLTIPQSLQLRADQVIQ